MNCPVIVFVYNRPGHTKRLLNSIANSSIAELVDLYVFCDGPKSIADEDGVKSVRELVRSFSGTKSIVVRDSSVNKGLAASVRAGVSDVFNEHDAVIVLEDDLELSPVALEYLKMCAVKLRSYPEIFSFTGYSYPQRTLRHRDSYPCDNFYLARPCSWAWGTWKDRWESVQWSGDIFDSFLRRTDIQEDFRLQCGSDVSRMLKKQLSGQISSWAILFTYNCFLQKRYCSYPVKSYVNNGGADGSGTHKGLNSEYIFNEQLNGEVEDNFSEKFHLDPDVFSQFDQFVRKKYYFRRLRFEIEKLVNKVL